MDIIRKVRGLLGTEHRAAAMVASGTAVGNLVAFGATVVLVRLFAPSEFGTFSLLTALMMMAATIACGRFEFAITLPKQRRDAMAVMVTGALVATCLVSALFLIVSLLPSGVALPLPQEARSLLWAVPAMLAPVAVTQLLVSWAQREARFGAIARRPVVQSTGVALTQVGAGLAGWGVSGLVWGYVAGQVVAGVSLLVGSRLPRSWGSIKAAAWRYRRFPAVLMPAGLLNSAATQMPVLLIGAYYGSHAVGIFALTMRVLAVPAVLIGDAIANVYLSRLAEMHRNGDQSAGQLFSRTTRLLLTFACLVAGALLTLGPWVFGAVFGGEWTESGRAAQAMSIGAAASLVSAPLSMTLIVKERTRTQLTWDLGRVVAIVATFTVMHQYAAAFLPTIWAYSIVMTGFSIISWALCRHAIVTSVRAAATDC